MGPSGVGKTTLLNTLLGFHIPSVGAVEIVGKTPDALGFNYLLELVSYAPQSASVFSGTLRENLLYGVEAGDVTDYNLDEVINILQFQTDVENKEPLTKDSVIGNGGRSLSGGEKQRISIGRALLRKKNILILDEPTSALDKQTARYIMEEIRHRVSTIIVVSHDPDVIAMGDVRIDLQIFRKVIDY
jgi:ATP-binding cassette subfamily B protein